MPMMSIASASQRSRATPAQAVAWGFVAASSLCCALGSAGPTSGLLAPAQPVAETETTSLTGFLAGDGSRVLLVFGRELDPATLRASVFAVMRADGEASRLSRASLGRSNEVDEHRSVWLEGEFSSTAGPGPVAVQVVGPLFAEDGRSLVGLRTKLAPTSEPDHIVDAQLAPGDCHERGGLAAAEGSSSWRVRSYWSDAMWLTESNLGALARAELRLPGGGRSRLRGVADVELRRESEMTDNVVDLCFALEPGQHPPSSGAKLWIPQGALVDPQGLASAAQDLSLVVTKAQED